MFNNIHYALLHPQPQQQNLNQASKTVYPASPSASLPHQPLPTQWYRNRHQHHPSLHTTSKAQACPKAGSSPAVQGFCMAEHCTQCPVRLIAANCWRTKIQKWPDKCMAVIFPCMAASYLLMWKKQDFAGLWQYSGKSETGKWTEIWPFRVSP